MGNSLPREPIAAWAAAGATATWTNLIGATSRGFTEIQLTSTARYQTENPQGSNLAENNLTGWDFSGQHLANAQLLYSTWWRC